MPACCLASGSVRARQMPQSARCGERGPDLLPGEPPAALSARRDPTPWSAATRGRSPAPGSLNSWHHSISPRRVGPTKRSRCSSVPWARIVGAAQAPILRSGRCDAGPGELLVDDELVHRVGAEPVRRGPVRASGSRSRRERARCSAVRRGRRSAAASVAHLGAEGVVGVAEVDVHVAAYVARGEVGQPCGVRARGADQAAQGERAAQVEVGVVLEGEADPAEHLDAGLRDRDRAVEARPPRRRARRTRAARRPRVAARAASQAAAVTDSLVSSISAHRCLIAWKAPIFWPNCSRTPAYSTAVSRHHRAIPEASAAASVTTQRAAAGRRRGPGTTVAVRSRSGRPTRPSRVRSGVTAGLSVDAVEVGTSTHRRPRRRRQRVGRDPGRRGRPRSRARAQADAHLPGGDPARQARPSASRRATACRAAAPGTRPHAAASSATARSSSEPPPPTGSSGTAIADRPISATPPRLGEGGSTASSAGPGRLDRRPSEPRPLAERVGQLDVVVADPDRHGASSAPVVEPANGG